MTVPALALGVSKLALSTAATIASVGSSVAGFVAQNKQYEANAQAAKDAYFTQAHLTNKRVHDEQKAVAQKKNDNTIKRLKGEAAALNMAAEGGVTGLSVEQTLADFMRSEGVEATRLDANLANFQEQAYWEISQAQSTANNRINSVQPGSLVGVVASSVGAVSNWVGEVQDFNDLYDGDYDIG